MVIAELQIAGLQEGLQELPTFHFLQSCNSAILSGVRQEGA
jgi:hypothetical protein